MPGEVLGGAISAAIPVVGAGISAALERGWAKRDLAAQNFYNSPSQQLARLEAAGLPAAAFFSGGVSSQSDQPRASNIDPSLGTAEGINNYMQNRFQTKQLALLDAQTRKTEAEANEASGRAAWLGAEAPNFYGPINTNQAALMDIDKQRKDAERAAADSTSQIQQIIADRKDEQITSEIQRANAATDLARQQFRNNEDFLQFQRDFIKGINEGKDFWGTFKALLSMALLKQNR